MNWIHARAQLWEAEEAVKAVALESHSDTSTYGFNRLVEEAWCAVDAAANYASLQVEKAPQVRGTPRVYGGSHRAVD